LILYEFSLIISDLPYIGVGVERVKIFWERRWLYRYSFLYNTISSEILLVRCLLWY